MQKVVTHHYETECQLKCTDNGRVVTADVDYFKQKEYLTVLIEGKVKLKLTYTKFGEYVGSMSGLEFITDGPEFKFTSSY
jgi:hypothetical protein|tara:strand:+ start:80 stop:319 length:240 start_codon:yes stop_codon:yes gene_type:complete